MSELLTGLIKEHSRILRAPFLEVVSTEADGQIRNSLTRNLALSWRGYELDYPQGAPQYVIDALNKVSDQMTVVMLPQFMNPIRKGEQARHESLVKKAQDLGEQLSDEDRLGTQRMARRILRAVNGIIADRGWSNEPDDLDMFTRHFRSSSRVMDSDFSSQRPYLRPLDYEGLLLDKPEGSIHHPPVNFAARFKGTVFESVRFLQFAAKTGLMPADHKGDLYPQRAEVDIDLSVLPELTDGLDINARRWDLNPERLKQYNEATDELTNDLLRKMGFLKKGKQLDPTANVTFEGSGCYLGHPREPKLYARAKRNWATRLGGEKYYDEVTIFYVYDKLSDEYLKEKYPSRYPTF